MDSNNLPNNNYSPDAEANNGYQNNGYPENSYQNNGYQNSEYQNNAYQNNGYQNNGYQNNAYQNNSYPDNSYQNNGYQNNGYQNSWNSTNSYQNNVNPNNGYQTNIYQNSQQPVNNYASNQYQNTAKTSILNKRNIFIGLAAIVAAVIALSVGGFLITNIFFKPHYNCSAEKSANIEEYLNCHPSEVKDFNDRMSNDSDFSTKIEAKGDTLNLTVQFKYHVPDEDISLLRNQVASSSNNFSRIFPSAEEIKSKIISPIHLHYTLLNDDGGFITDKDYLAN